MRWIRLHQVCLWVIGTIGSSSTLSLSRKHCLTLEMVRKLDRELRIPVDKCRPTLPTLIAALFYDLSTDKEIKIPSIGEKRERELRSPTART
ncbi:hypothetical protein [Microcoleus vaginatus]|uniref:hypothetical protein n=1 Tax=Microcoleus vaginatus TaxID=119532 RepID=UPI00192CA720